MQGFHLSTVVVRAGEACELLVLHATDYWRIVQQGEQRRLLSHLSILMQVGRQSPFQLGPWLAPFQMRSQDSGLKLPKSKSEL